MIVFGRGEVRSTSAIERSGYSFEIAFVLASIRMVISSAEP